MIEFGYRMMIIGLKRKLQNINSYFICRYHNETNVFPSSGVLMVK